MPTTIPPFRAHLNAFSATLCAVLTVGALAWGAALGMVVFACRGLERFSVLSLGWGAGHMPLLEWAAGLLILPVCLWLGAWMYRRALIVERELQAQEDGGKPALPPPGTPGAA